MKHPSTALHFCRRTLAPIKEVRYARTESHQLRGILNDVAGNYQAFAEAQIGRGSLPVSKAETRIAGLPFGAPKYKTPLAEVRKALGIDAG